MLLADDYLIRHSARGGRVSEESQSIRVEDLPESYQIVAKLIGLEGALTLGSVLGGMTLYFPKLDSVLSKARDKKIVAEFNGHNHKVLARKYKLTESWIREVLKRARIKEPQNVD